MTCQQTGGAVVNEGERPTSAGRRDSVLRHREAVLRRMGESSVDAVVVGSQSNFFYCTGYHTPTWHLPGRPIFLVLDHTGRATAVVNAAEAQQVLEGAIDVEVETYTDPLPVRVSGVVQMHHTEAAQSTVLLVVKESGSRSIGVEMVGAPPSHLSPRLVDALRGEDGLTTVDVTLMLADIRQVKDDVEIAGIRRAAWTLGYAFETFAERAAVGMTERELRGVFLEATAAAGADFTAYVAVRHTDGDLLGPAGGRAWNAGSVLYIDCGLCVEGYWADLSRHYVASNRTPELAREYSSLIEALEHERAVIRDGATCADVAETVRSLLGEARYGRFGHGIGLQFLEPPSLACVDHTRLTSGMTLCIEPIGMFAHAGELIAEEMVVVTADGHELLSPPMPRELGVIA